MLVQDLDGHRLDIALPSLPCTIAAEDPPELGGILARLLLNAALVCFAVTGIFRHA